MKKGLWITNTSNRARLLAKAQLMGATSVAVRTDNEWLLDSIADFHAVGIEVYGWRWPAVTNDGFHDRYYFAQDQADHVAADLMPAGLDGYILDAEGTSQHPNRDWNSTLVDLNALAKAFFDTIANAKDANRAARLNQGRFLVGLTSGNRFPTQQRHAPWETMVAYCDTLFPQTYWLTSDQGPVLPVHGGTPESTVALAMTAWSKIQDGRRIVPVGGPLKLSSAEDLVAFANVARERGWDEAHFYVDERQVSDDKYEDIAGA